MQNLSQIKSYSSTILFLFQQFLYFIKGPSEFRQNLNLLLITKNRKQMEQNQKHTLTCHVSKLENINLGVKQVLSLLIFKEIRAKN